MIGNDGRDFMVIIYSAGEETFFRESQALKLPERGFQYKSCTVIYKSYFLINK
jgi:hypothetical protein